ncbi:response regulator transcription factor [Metabacillus idriensis]|uniref:response regulator transcription factor n=1 Tax=Metabacillus idriensis TaxID=324768 RepID=UPI00174E5459|nr:helix-turn-helix transcriptional regulator [Metabacillus idriensis]
MNSQKTIDQFTLLESKIIELIAEEMPNKEIASTLNYSQRTIEYNITQLFKKLDVSTRVGIVAQAYKRNIV